MATSLLALLNEVEEALVQKSARQLGLSWDVSRIVNTQHGLARLTMTPRPNTGAAQSNAGAAQLRGAIFLQHRVLAEGDISLKVSFSWHGSDAFPSILVDAKPLVEWKTEAVRIAALWLAGPDAAANIPPTPKTPPVFEKAG
jgi:hypothetical protein